MSIFTTSNTPNPLRYLGAGLFALLLMAATAVPAQAQMDDGELPKIDFSANLMQSAQFLSVDEDQGETALAGNWSGFHQVRAGLTSSIQFSENVSGLLMIQAEPNDFGQNGFSPAVDFAILDLQLTDNLTFRTGTPVTGLMNFRGFSDGPITQGNPLIGNSLADMITAAHGVKLIGGFDSFGFDLTVNRSFLEDFTNGNLVASSGVNVIGKFRFTGSEIFKFGAGGAFHTGKGVLPNSCGADTRGLVFACGDRENYNLASKTTASNSTNTHANMPAGTIVHADAKVTPGSADIDAWVGYATESDYSAPVDTASVPYIKNDPYNGSTYSALFGGLGLKYSFSDSFYLAGRFTHASDQSDAVSDFDNTSMNRIQLGFGYNVYEKALFKLEYVNQSETGLAQGSGTALSQIGDNWSGVTAELSFNF